MKRNGSLGTEGESGYLGGYNELSKCRSDYEAMCIKAAKWLLEEDQDVHSRGDFSSYDLHVKIYGSSPDFSLPPDKNQGCVVYFHVMMHST